MSRVLTFLLVATAFVGCAERDPRVTTDSGSDATRPDSGVPDGGSSDSTMDSAASDSGADASDGSSPMDAAPDGDPRDGGPDDTGLVDAMPDAISDTGVPDTRPADTGVAPRSDHHIHVEVDNFCRMTVTPTEITIPADQTAYFDWHNHSVDYEIDVWMSYGGGFTELGRGRTWDEPIGHCIGPRVGDEYADISTACSSHRFLIHCD